MGGRGGGRQVKFYPYKKVERKNTLRGSFKTALSFNHTGGGVTKSVHPLKGLEGGGHEKFYPVLRGGAQHFLDPCFPIL